MWVPGSGLCEGLRNTPQIVLPREKYSFQLPPPPPPNKKVLMAHIPLIAHHYFSTLAALLLLTHPPPFSLRGSCLLAAFFFGGHLGFVPQQPEKDKSDAEFTNKLPFSKPNLYVFYPFSYLHRLVCTSFRIIFPLVSDYPSGCAYTLTLGPNHRALLLQITVYIQTITTTPALATSFDLYLVHFPLFSHLSTIIKPGTLKQLTSYNKQEYN